MPSLTTPCLSTSSLANADRTPAESSHHGQAPKSWACLREDDQLAVTRAALLVAYQTVASQADALADEMEGGALLDRGGPDALHLLASVLRAAGEEQRLERSTPPGRAALASVRIDLGALEPAGHA